MLLDCEKNARTSSSYNNAKSPYTIHEAPYVQTIQFQSVESISDKDVLLKTYP